ncbi:hypothetical protein PSH55_22160, partial [Pseudoalteromonas sp. Angola-31]|nr:hypothetical protein [Pseudoalteromonas sp. Angola-31]
ILCESEIMKELNELECKVVTGGALNADNTIGLGLGIVGVAGSIAGAAAGAFFFPVIAAAAGGWYIGSSLYSMATE